MELHDNYKISNAKYFNVQPNQWTRVKLKHVLKSPITDGPHETPELIDDGIPFVSAEAIKSLRVNFNLKRGYISRSDHERFCKKCKPQRGDILLVKSGATTGNIALVDTDEEFSVWSPLALIRSDPAIVLNTYLFQYLQSSEFRCQVELFWNYGTQQNIGMEVLGNQYVVYPPIPIQHAIVAYLNRKTVQIDRIIAYKETLIELLKETRQSIISEAVTKGIDPNVPLTDSNAEWIGQIPLHWKMSQSRWLFALRKDRAFPDDEQLTASQKYGIVYQKDYMEQGTRVVQVITGDDILKHVEPNDFVISMRSFQGGIEWSGLRGKISSAYVMLIPDNEKVYAPYFRWLLKSHKYIRALQSTSNLVRDGQALRYNNFKQVELPLIPIKEQMRIASFLDAKTTLIDNLAEENQKQIGLLKEYRAAIISETVTGKTKVVKGD